MEYKMFKVTSYDEYYKKHLPIIKNICQEKKVDFAYIMALNEAVCNAFRYNVKGEYKGNAEISMIVSDSDITCRIYAQTMPFNVVNLYEKIQKIGNDHNVKDLSWGEYTQDWEGGRGFWFMLYGVDFLQIDITSHEISLIYSNFMSEKTRPKKIKFLAKKLFIKKNGVVL